MPPVTRRPRGRKDRHPALIPVVLLGATMLVSAWGFFNSRQEARLAFQDDLRLRAEAEAASVHATLSSMRSDLVFLTQSNPIFEFPRIVAMENPTARRWGRLDTEATLIRFLEVHPEIQAARVHEGSTVHILVRRREGVPTVVVPSNDPVAGEADLVGRFALGDDEQLVLEVAVGWEEVLHLASPGGRDVLAIATGGEAEPPHSACVHMPIADDAWLPEIEEQLCVATPVGGGLQAELQLAARFRKTLAVNAGLTLLGLIAGVFAYRAVRRSAAAEAVHEQDLRVRELERQVLHSERLASVGRLAAGLAHEINNPLEGMSNYLEVLRADIREQRYDRAASVVENIREGVNRVAGITGRVLTYSDPGRAPRQVLDLRDVVAESVTFLSSREEFRHIRFNNDPPVDPVRVSGDPITLGQLFLNLLLNACESETNTAVELEWGGNEGLVEVQICDRGPGIPTEILGRIFEPFYSDRGSTGLGLSVCFGVVASHGGSLKADNRETGGAVFVVQLPRYTAGDGHREESA